MTSTDANSERYSLPKPSELHTKCIPDTETTLSLEDTTGLLKTEQIFEDYRHHALADLCVLVE